MAATSMNKETILEVYLRRRDCESIRPIANKIDIPKSTLHYNLPKIEAEIKRRQNEILTCPLKQLLDRILTYVMEGKMSTRATSKVLADMDGITICPTTIGSLLKVCSNIAKSLNSNVNLSKVKCAIFDEVFQKKSPILGFTDPMTGIVMLKAETYRNKKSWSKFLASLKKQSLMPESTVTDGASGLLSGLSNIFPEVVKIRDCFHFFKILTRAVKRLEIHCYTQIVEVDKLKGTLSKGFLTSTEKSLNECIDLYDKLYFLEKDIRQAFYIRCETGIRQYISFFELGRKLKILEFVLKIVFEKFKEISSIREAYTYVKNSFNELIAFKKFLEKKVAEMFGSQNSHSVLGYFMKMAEYLDHFHRSYEDNKPKIKWAKKIVKLRSEPRKTTYICQEEVDNGINMAVELYSEVFKSNSLIECVNSVIRVHLNSYKSIPSWFCDLFSYYWNNRKFGRGKRKGSSPIDLYTGDRSTKSWKDKILD